ncbi:toll/interleukin-1 receptor domain-containing protein [Pseudomonas sp.]|uniref:toll/interleukin-1 receptor domain-containing protein n=1 Tax=Pseudomonas sp. TaxID=306 RepID=UPI004053ABCC
MNPSERIKHIKEISKELAKEDWALLDLTLRQFGLPWTDQWGGGDKEHYVIEMLSEAKDEPLLELAKHLGLASQLETPYEPSFWENTEARIFLSHLAKNKVETSKIKDCLESYGISAFVAHEDIEPTKQWQTEIESALSTMDALVALLSPGFKESNWCDQEVGVAIGRQLPVVAVRQGLDPYGFIGKYQALQGAGKTPEKLAREIFELLHEMPGVGQKITSALVSQLVNSRSFDESKKLISLIQKSKFVTSKHAAAMKEAAENNDQVSYSWGVPEQINQISQQFES